MVIKYAPCGSLGGGRVSIFVNVGNTYSRQGNYAKANEQYTIAENLGREHLGAEKGNQIDGMGIVICALRSRAFALKRAGKEDEGKEILKEVIKMQIELNTLNEQKLEEIEAEKLKAQMAQLELNDPSILA
jgi:tetratricopeptide (TPR) repeat protein